MTFLLKKIKFENSESFSACCLVIIIACVSFEKLSLKLIHVPFVLAGLPCILPVSMANQRW